MTMPSVVFACLVVKVAMKIMVITAGARARVHIVIISEIVLGVTDNIERLRRRNRKAKTNTSEREIYCIQWNGLKWPFECKTHSFLLR